MDSVPVHSSEMTPQSKLRQSFQLLGSLLLTLVSAAAYCQDVLQDILVASASLASKETYRILSNLEVEEEKFGFAMVAVFCISVVVVGIETLKKVNRMRLIKNYRRMYLMIIPACLTNLGPVFITFMKFTLSTKCVKRLYDNEVDLHYDERILEQAASSTKTKEALCENLPMLVIVCFKMALSAKVSLLEILSSTSSAILFTKVVVAYAAQRMTIAMGYVKMVLANLLVAAFMYSTLILITAFAIESERDGILVRTNAKSGVEESSGLVFLLLIFPTIFYCLLPFTIYDLIPCFLSDSLAIKEYFQKPPSIVWYGSVVLHVLALIFNLGTASYFFQRDPISLFEDIKMSYNGFGCEAQVMGMTLPSYICGQWDLKVGAGRIYFKSFIIASVIISCVMFLITVSQTLGMSYRERTHYKKTYERFLNQEIMNLVDGTDVKTIHNPFNDYNELVKHHLQIFSKFLSKGLSNEVGK